MLIYWIDVHDLKIMRMQESDENTQRSSMNPALEVNYILGKSEQIRSKYLAATHAQTSLSFQGVYMPVPNF